MKWLLNLLAAWILEQIKNGTAEELGHALKRELDAFVIPKVRKFKEDLFKHLKEQAAIKTPDLKFDDALWAYLDSVFEELLPDSTSVANLAMSKSQEPEQSEAQSALA